MIFTYDHKVVNALPAVDGNAAAIVTDIISMKGYDHATFIWTFGVVDASSESTVNLIAYKGENVTTAATAFAASGYRAEVTANGDTLEALTAMPAAGVSIGTGKTLDITGDDATIVVEIDAEDLAPTIANPFDTVKMGVTMSAHSILMSCICILSKGRYQNTEQPSAITD